MDANHRAAGRQRLYRKAAEEEFGAKPWTILTTDDEKAYLLRALKKRYGHDASITSRRLKKARDTDTLPDFGAGQLKQDDYLNDETH